MNLRNMYNSLTSDFWLLITIVVWDRLCIKHHAWERTKMQDGWNCCTLKQIYTYSHFGKQQSALTLSWREAIVHCFSVFSATTALLVCFIDLSSFLKLEITVSFRVSSLWSKFPCDDDIFMLDPTCWTYRVILCTECSIRVYHLHHKFF